MVDAMVYLGVRRYRTVATVRSLQHWLHSHRAAPTRSQLPPSLAPSPKLSLHSLGAREPCKPHFRQVQVRVSMEQGTRDCSGPASPHSKHYGSSSR